MMEKVIQAPNITEVTKKYVGKWVVLSDDYKEVIASGETLSAVLKKTSDKKRKMAFIVLPNISYSPSSLLL